jgi:phage gp46-like protein
MEELEGSVHLFDNGDGGQIDIQNGQTCMDAGLESAMYESLFTGEWWGNEIAASESEKHIVSLEELFNRTLTNDLRLEFEERARQSTQWFIDDGISKQNNITASIIRSDVLLLEIELIKPDATKVPFKYEINWEKQFIKPISCI